MTADGCTSSVSTTCSMRSACNPMLVFALAACNQVFGVHDTVSAGPAFYDAGIDAPFACPPIGGSPPQFSAFLHQDFVQDCADYSIAGGRATALCSDATSATSINEGARDR